MNCTFEQHHPDSWTRWAHPTPDGTEGNRNHLLLNNKALTKKLKTGVIELNLHEGNEKYVMNTKTKTK